MVPSLPLLPCELSVFVKENPDRKKKKKKDAKCVLLTEENINDKFLKRIKKSKYEKDIEFVKLFDRNISFLEDKKVLFQ